MRIDRLVVVAAALAASSVMIGCGSDKNSNTPATTPSLGSTSLSTTPLATTGSSTMDTSSVATTTP